MSVTLAEAIKAAEPLRGRWAVLRHGGRSNHIWRLAGTWNADFSYAAGCARDLYRTKATALRQGGVALITPEGVCEAFDSGPLLRSRW